MEDTTEPNNDETFDLDTNQIIEQHQQQRDIETLTYSDKFDKKFEAAWDAYHKYSKVADAIIIQRTKARIATLETRVKAVQAAVEKRMIAPQQETFGKIQNVHQTERTSHELYTIYEGPNVKGDDMKGLYF